MPLTLTLKLYGANGQQFPLHTHVPKVIYKFHKIMD